MTTSTSPASVLGMRIAHRMMNTDLVRLTSLAEQVAAGRSACLDARAGAVDRWVTQLCDEIHHHHSVEDDVAWPVIAAHAREHVDLSVLTDDHEALGPLLDAVRGAAARFGTAPNAERRAAATGLASALAVLRDHLAEHIAAEEGGVFPVIERLVPAADWARVEKAASRGGAGLGFMLPRALAVASEQEQRELAATSGRAQVLLGAMVARVLVPRHRRREALVFG